MERNGSDFVYQLPRRDTQNMKYLGWVVGLLAGTMAGILAFGAMRVAVDAPGQPVGVWLVPVFLVLGCWFFLRVAGFGFCLATNRSRQRLEVVGSRMGYAEYLLVGWYRRRLECSEVSQLRVEKLESHRDLIDGWFLGICDPNWGVLAVYSGDRLQMLMAPGYPVNVVASVGRQLIADLGWPEKLLTYQTTSAEPDALLSNGSAEASHTPAG